MSIKNDSPLVSVLMPAFNAEKYIAQSIESILVQTYTNIELIVLNDASSDTTLKIAKNYQKKDPRVKVYSNTTNLNIAESRNILVSKAMGKYIAWQDADDISLPDRLKLQVEFLEKHSDVGIVGGFLEFFDEKGKKSIRKYAPDDASLRKTIFRYSPVAQPAAMIRATALKHAGLYGKDLSPAEDIDMSFRIGTKYKIANLQEIVLRYRHHATSSTFNNLTKIELITIKTRFRYLLNENYKLSFFDLAYNLLQSLSIFIIPAKIKIQMFNKIRNSNK